MSDPQTLAVYAQQAAQYAKITGGDDPQLERFMGTLSRGRVLDLGCGPGRTAATMAAAGFEVTALDAVPEMVAMAAAHPGVTAKVGSFEDIEGAYDGIWANFSLLHAPRAAMPVHLARIAKALPAGGLFHIGMKLGAGSARDSIGRLYTYYEEDTLVSLLNAAGFTVSHRDYGTDKGLDGTMADWICLLAHKEPYE